MEEDNGPQARRTWDDMDVQEFARLLGEEIDKQIEAPDEKRFWLVERCSHCGSKVRRFVSYNELTNAMDDRNSRKLKQEVKSGAIEFYRRTKVPCEDCLAHPTRPSIIMSRVCVISSFADSKEE